ncbi:MAG: HD domain-containing protein [Bacteroidota bacterium]
MRLQKTRQFIIEKLHHRFVDSTYYHGVSHSLEVEEACIDICKSELSISKNDAELLQIAALSHDIGHSEKKCGHEQLGCNFITKNLPVYGYSDKEIELIRRLILATKFPHEPKTKLEEIICDADLSYIASGSYHDQADRLRKELTELFDHKFDSNIEWLKYQLDFLKNHKFFTEYAMNYFEPVKKTIISDIEEKLNSNS